MTRLGWLAGRRGKMIVGVMLAISLSACTTTDIMTVGGAAGGAYAGSEIGGALGGPVGRGIGTFVGLLAGGAAGNATGKMLDGSTPPPSAYATVAPSYTPQYTPQAPVMPNLTPSYVTPGGFEVYQTTGGGQMAVHRTNRQDVWVTPTRQGVSCRQTFNGQIWSRESANIPCFNG